MPIDPKELLRQAYKVKDPIDPKELLVRAYGADPTKAPRRAAPAVKQPTAPTFTGPIKKDTITGKVDWGERVQSDMRAIEHKTGLSAPQLKTAIQYGGAEKNPDLKRYAALSKDPSVSQKSLRDTAKGLGYGTENLAATLMGWGEGAFDFLSSSANKGLAYLTSWGGRSPNDVSRGFEKAAEQVYQWTPTEDYRRNIEERYNPSENLRTAGRIQSGIADMLPTIAINTAVPGAGLGMMGMKVAGSSAQEAYQKTGAVERSNLYGVLAGTLEIATEKMFGGIPGLGEGKIGQIAKKAVNKVMSIPGVSKALDILGEGVEEVVSDLVDPVLQRITIDPNAPAATKEELLESFTAGALLSGILQGAFGIMGKIDGTSSVESGSQVQYNEDSRADLQSQEGVKVDGEETGLRADRVTLNPAANPSEVGPELNVRRGVDIRRSGENTQVSAGEGGEVDGRKETGTAGSERGATTPTYSNAEDQGGLGPDGLGGRRFDIRREGETTQVSAGATGKTRAYEFREPDQVDLSPLEQSVLSQSQVDGVKVLFADGPITRTADGGSEAIDANGVYIGDGIIILPRNSESYRHELNHYIAEIMPEQNRRFVDEVQFQLNTSDPKVAALIQDYYQRYKQAKPNFTEQDIYNEIAASVFNENDPEVYGFFFKDPSSVEAALQQLESEFQNHHSARSKPQDNAQPLSDSSNLPSPPGPSGGSGSSGAAGDTLNPAQIAGMKPEDASTTPVLPPSGVEGGNKRSQFADSVEEQTVFDDTYKQMAREDPAIQSYQGITNQETMEEALRALDLGGQKRVSDWYSKRGNYTPVDVATGFILLKRYQDIGDYSEMLKVTEHLRQMGTSAGQTVQTFAILGRMTPEGMQYYAQKSLADAFETMKKNRSQKWIDENRKRFSLTEQDAAFIQDRMMKASQLPEGRDKNILIAEVASRIQEKIPPLPGQGIKAYARISMLFNPKTNLRNVLGNALIMPQHIVSDFIGSGIDKAIAKKTGVRTTGNFDPASFQGMKKGIYESYDDFRRKINTRNMGGNRFEIGEGPSFNQHHTGVLADARNKLSRSLNALDRVTSFLLDAGDRPFYEMWFLNSLNNQMELNHTAQPTAEMVDIAAQEALERTWQDSNTFTKSVQGVRKFLNMVNVGGYGLGDMMMPFVKTPANLTKAMVEFSPVGLVKGISVDALRFKNAVETGTATPAMQKQFVSSLSKGITGTLAMIGYGLLANAGMLTGAGPEDRDAANFERNVLGINPYSVKLGDTTASYEWAQPLGGNMAMAADFVKALRENTADRPQANNYLNAIYEGIKSGGQVLYSQSFLKGIQDLFKEDDPFQGVIGGMLGEPAKFTPSFLAQFARLGDNTARSSYVHDDPMQTAQNQVKARLPGARQTLEPVVDVLGRDVPADGSVWGVFFNPANTSTASPTPQAEEMYRLYRATGDAAVLPPAAPWNFQGDDGKVTLSPQQKTQFQRTTGQIITQEVAKLMGEKGYQALSDKDKAEVLKDLYSYATAAAKAQTGKYTLNTSQQKIEDAKRQGIDPAYRFLMDAYTPKDGSSADVCKAINGLNLPNEKKAVLYGLRYPTATLNPFEEMEQPYVKKLGLTGDEYLKVREILNTTKPDYDKYGNAVAGSGKSKKVGAIIHQTGLSAYDAVKVYNELTVFKHSPEELSSSARGKMEKAAKYNMSQQKFLDLYNLYLISTGWDQNGDGKTDAGSKKADAIQRWMKYGLSSQQASFFWDILNKG